jgi:Zn-dependent peptidase ImmA (M78 family)
MGASTIPIYEARCRMIVDRIEKRAGDVLRAANAKSIPVPVESIVAKHQIRLSRAPHRSFSGMLIRKDGYALIGINSGEAPVRQRFTIAHELGHFFLHPQKDAFVDYRDNSRDVMRTPREQQANMFAAALLMPGELLQKDVRPFASVGLSEDRLYALARRYMVSEDAMRFRLMNLNILSIR